MLNQLGGRFLSRVLRMGSMPKVVAEATIITAGSVVGAIGTMLGLRLLTEAVPASEFGRFVLANGVGALATGVALQPVAQAALRFYPDLADGGCLGQLRDVMAAEFLRRLSVVWALLLFCALVDRAVFRWLPGTAWLALILTLAVDAGRTIEIVLRNASGDQAGYAFVGALDAWLRPLAAAGAAWLLAPAVEALLWGQLLGGLVVIAAFSRPLPRPDRAVRQPWRNELRAYGAPLTWAPLLGWLISLADRYVIGALLGTAAVGVYAAAHGLVSRPMLMLGGIADATLRQKLYAAFSRGDRSAQHRIVTLWLAANALAGASVLAILVFFGELVVGVLLAASFREPVLSLLLPLGLGFVLTLVWQAAVRRLYALGRTRLVLVADGLAGAVAVSGAAAGAWMAGLTGVAWAMPVSAAIQLLIVVILGR